MWILEKWCFSPQDKGVYQRKIGTNSYRWFFICPSEQESTFPVIFVPVKLNQQRFLITTQASFLCGRSKKMSKIASTKDLWYPYHHLDESRREHTPPCGASSCQDGIFLWEFLWLLEWKQWKRLECTLWQSSGRHLGSRNAWLHGTRNPAKELLWMTGQTEIREVESTSFGSDREKRSRRLAFHWPMMCRRASRSCCHFWSAPLNSISMKAPMDVCMLADANKLQNFTRTTNDG